MSGAIAVHGLKDLNRALARTSKEVRLGIRKELREVAKPVANTAEQLARTNIKGIRNRVDADTGPDWSLMRVGVTQDLVYVAPKQRGATSKGRKRETFAALLMAEAMQPALDIHSAEIERELDQMLGRISEDFSHG